MFIKRISKMYKGKEHFSFRLVESIRINGKPRHRTIVDMGKLPSFSGIDMKLLANAIEQQLCGQGAMFDNLSADIQAIAKRFATKIVKEGLYAPSNKKAEAVETKAVDFQSVDLGSVENEDSRTIGGEAACLEMLRSLGVPDFLAGLIENQARLRHCLIAWVCRMTHPASELATSRWVQGRSAVCELLGMADARVTKDHLYEAARLLDKHKEAIEDFLAQKAETLFEAPDNIWLYDLTNTYLEGRKLGSKIAAFGRSKEKRNDAKLLSLALLCNSSGFIKKSRIYSGNISEPSTLLEVIASVKNPATLFDKKQIVVMDAGIATDANLKALVDKGYDYLCVSRKKMREYKLGADAPATVYDNNGSPIEMTRVIDDNAKELVLQIKSKAKAEKEQSISVKAGGRFEQELKSLAEGLARPGGRLKKADKVHEKLGRIKQKYAAVSVHYQINTQQQDGLITDIAWTRLPATPKEEGKYFLRTSVLNMKEGQIWDIYNTLTEIEATNRCLKTDLSLRPVYHQTDNNMEAHINLGVLAYHIVSVIRHKLKKKGIAYGWKRLIEEFAAQTIITTSFIDKDHAKHYSRGCTRPHQELTEVYKALDLPSTPMKRKNYVVPQN